MSLVSTKDLFPKAYKEGYALGAFNCHNMEFVQAIVTAASELSSPLILQIPNANCKYPNRIYLEKIVEAAIIESDIPIALHLDHGSSFDICKTCIDEGFTSVMIDGSKLPFNENIALTKHVVEYAHDKGIAVEAELGSLGGMEDDIIVDEKYANLTRPEDVLEFVEKTGCDSLAIAIGTSHGAFKFKPEDDPKLHFEILEEIEKSIPGFPLVLHGASSIPAEYADTINQYGGQISNAIGIPDDQLKIAASMAICKVNIDSDMRLAMTAAIRKHFSEHPGEFDPRQYLSPSKAVITELVKNKLQILGSVGKA